MQQTDGALIAIDEVNRATIRHINSEADIALICDNAIALFETAIGRERSVNDGDLVTVNLSCGCESMVLQAEIPARAAMHLIEISQGRCFVVRQRDPWDTAHETVRRAASLESGEFFERNVVRNRRLH